MNISEKQRKAACIVWGMLLLEKNVSKDQVELFKANLDHSLLTNKSTEISSLSFGLSGRAGHNLLKKAAREAGIAESLFLDPAFSMTFDNEDNIILDGNKQSADVILQDFISEEVSQQKDASMTSNSTENRTENSSHRGTGQKQSSGLSVSELKPGSDDHKRYEAYQWYVQGRTRARRLATYSRLAKWWGSPLNLLALIPGISFLTSGLYIYLNREAFQESRSVSAPIMHFIISCLPFFNLAQNFHCCLEIRHVFQSEIDPLLNQYFNIPNDNLKTKDLDLDSDSSIIKFRGTRVRIKKLKIFNDDLAPQNDKVVLRHLTENEFQAYSRRPKDNKTANAEEKSGERNKKFVRKVPRNTGNQYHIYMDQEQNKRFEEQLQKLQPQKQSKKSKDTVTLFSAALTSTHKAESKTQSVKLKGQVMEMHKAYQPTK